MLELTLYARYYRIALILNPSLRAPIYVELVDTFFAALERSSITGRGRSASADPHPFHLPQNSPHAPAN
jgi:hypothetical protein